MVDRKLLLADLKKQVITLEKDLREQVSAVTEVGSALRAEYDRAFAVKRTAATWAAWRDERVTQAAVAWVLGTAFVRFCEDNGLLPEPFLAAPTLDGMTAAEESQEEFFRQNRSETDRGWLLAAFSAIGSTQAGRLLFDERHNAAYQIPVSHDAAKALIAFWRRRSEDGALVHNFTDPDWDTRFLGDLYQDLSEHAKKTYALLQTPDFVEEFILDLTLTPAIEEFGYDVVKMIDPTCGSGHFLLGAFHRLLKEWERAGKEPYERVRLALDAVHGVDINPFAVAIARFRLLVATFKASELKTFHEASKYGFPLHVAVGDSLLKNRPNKLPGIDDVDDFSYITEDLDDHPEILTEGRFHVVVGNPPYITVGDEAASANYRDRYDACHRQYTLSVPFAQRFFKLAKGQDGDGRGSGYVGQITSNGFMKREFGRKLIQEYFSTWVDLTHIVDTSGAYIPGHGTPTVVLVGRNRNQGRSECIRTVMGIRGEPSAPAEPSKGQVWRAIVEQIGTAGSESAWVSVDDLPRARFKVFPWSLTGGGAAALAEAISDRPTRLGECIDVVGRTTHTGLDDAFYLSRAAACTQGLGRAVVPVVLGEGVRDFFGITDLVTLFPYDTDGNHRTPSGREMSFYWRLRTVLRRRMDFGQTPEERKLRWFDHSMFFRKRFISPLSIPFAFVATHNHFVLDRGGKVFNRSAPVIKLAEGATEEEHLRLLGVLNSSAACFWLKQVSHNKGGQSGTGGFTTDEWERFYEFTGTKLEDFPLPEEYPTQLAAELDSFGNRLAEISPANITRRGPISRESLAQARVNWSLIRAKMVALQEELDWHVYSLYGLIDDLRAPRHSVPALNHGERAFEIVLARRMARGESANQWFSRHGSDPLTDLPEHWDPEYREIVQRRIEIIESNRSIGLVERPEFKRRWHLAIGNKSWTWADQESAALRDWLLDRCETRDLWFHEVDGVEQPRPLTVNQLADELRKDPDVLNVADIYAQGKDLAKLLAELVADEHVPFLAALRYKDSGLDKRKDWEEVWDLQRQEDAAPDEPAKRRIRDTIPVPPKYGQGDFLKTGYWRNRGKLDVPKERFVSYPGASRDGDPSLLLGWAGWDHREQAQALATLIVDREQNEGWGRDRLTPLVAGLGELLPWVRQWHGEIDPTWGESPADMYESFHADVANRLHLTRADQTGWRPPKATRGGRGGGAKAAARSQR